MKKSALSLVLQLTAPAALLTFACVHNGDPEENPNDWMSPASSGGKVEGAGGEEGSGGDGSGGDGSGGDGGAGGASSPRVHLPIPPTSNVPRPDGDPGGLDVLDWAGFDAAVSYTLDDANRSQITHYDALQALGVPLTFYIQTGKSDAQNEIWAQALLDGHELGNHTKSHQDGGDGIGADTDEATSFLQDTFGVTPLTMAAPYGNSEYPAVAETRFLINRGVGSGSITPGSSTDSKRFNLPCTIPSEEASVEALSRPAENALTNGRWQIFLLHGFTGGSDGAYQPVNIEDFTASVQDVSSEPGLWIDTVLEVGAYWIAETLIETAEPTVDGNSSTWTWVLPQYFPSSRVVRVTVDGGTLSQEGRDLEWDSHGYYEVDLDAGELTLKP
jgi:peptidoglycan/xylan/chitin deacetylase (PgdA/CDA1 family)